MDVLSDILRLLRLRASVFFHSSFCGTWSVNTAGSGKATFHLIARGACWLHLANNKEPVALRGGDLVVFPRDARHVINDSPEPLLDSPSPGVTADENAEGPSTSLICGYFEFDSPQANPVLAALPEVVLIRSEDKENAMWLESLMRFIIAETESGSPGADAVVDKLSDVLFIQVVRTHMRQAGQDSGLLTALLDNRINQALQAVHANPGLQWSVEGLAKQAGMSRSAFARRFQQLMNATPMYYITQWRMMRAYDVLASTNRSVASIAEESGYQAEPSFRQAFKKHMGVGPGAVRRENKTANKKR